MFLLIYAVFNLVRIMLFPGHSWWWQLEVSVLGLIVLALFTVIVRGVDIYLDSTFPFERNPFKRIVVQFALTLAIVFIVRLILTILLVDRLNVNPSYDILVASVAINVFMVLSMVLSIFAYRFFMGWRGEKVIAANLEKEKAVVQYDNLKNQLNPHFLFNSLTSLNSLIFVNPQLASDFLQQLSKVYRYVLENKEKNLVALETEIKFINHYVQLLKTRFESGLDVTFNVNENSMQRAIVPVTLQVLIENAIKHNATQKESPLIIKIYVEQDYLIVENNLQKKNLVDGSNGQGLENLKNLYRYLSDRNVLIEQTERKFAVKIPLLEL